MMMRTTHAALLAAFAGLLMGGAAFAQVDWLVPPTFEVQRDIFWNFEGGPMDPPLYMGPDDEKLHGSDFVEWGGLNLLQGVIGIENPTGQPDMTGVLYVHIDNWNRNYPIKLIWLQADVYEAGGGDVWLEIYSDTGAQVPWQTVAYEQIPGTDVYRQTVFGAIRPNPAFEDFVFNYSVPGGGVAWIDNLRIATACVPEPGLIPIVGLGLGMVGILARRRK